MSHNCSIHIKILNSIIKLQLNNHKSVKKNSFKYILRLLAGKFGRICTEFPLTTFSSQIFPPNSCNHLLVQFFLQATFWIAFGFNFCTTFDQILVHLLQILRKDFSLRVILVFKYFSFCTRWCMQVTFKDKQHGKLWFAYKFDSQNT